MSKQSECVSVGVGGCLRVECVVVRVGGCVGVGVTVCVCVCVFGWVGLRERWRVSGLVGLCERVCE